MTTEVENAPVGDPIASWLPLVVGPRMADLDYIRSSWINAWKVSPWAGTVPNNLADEVYTQAIDQLLARGAKLITIRNQANPELLVAWACYELSSRGEAILHFVFVKPTYRRNGISKALVQYMLDAAGDYRYFITHRTAGSKFLKGWTHRPEIARRRDAGSRP